MKTTILAPKFISTQVSDVRYYFLNLSPQPGRGITVVCGGCEHCNPEYRIDRRDFAFHSIEYVAAGRGEVRLAGRRFPLQAGSLFSYDPRIHHAIRNDPNDPMTKYFVDFTGPEAIQLLKTHPLRDGVIQVSAPMEIMDLFETLQREGTRDTPFRAAICAALVRLLLLKTAALAMPAGVADTRALATYQRCKQHIERHFRDIRSLARIARDCHTDQAYLCRLFQRFDHQTPYQYLRRLKMNHAAEVLLGSGRLVKEVANDMGFSDPYHFSKSFKAVHRVSPLRFLKGSHRRSTVPSG